MDLTERMKRKTTHTHIWCRFSLSFEGHERIISHWVNEVNHLQRQHRDTLVDEHWGRHIKLQEQSNYTFFFLFIERTKQKRRRKRRSKKSVMCECARGGEMWTVKRRSEGTYSANAYAYTMVRLAALRIQHTTTWWVCVTRDIHCTTRKTATSTASIGKSSR